MVYRLEGMKDLKFGVIPEYNKTYNGHYVPFRVQLAFIREAIEIDKANSKRYAGKYIAL